MKKRLATLMLALGMCMGLTRQATTISLAQAQDDEMQGHDMDKMDDKKMCCDKMEHKHKKKSKKHKKDKKDAMDNMDMMDDKK